MAAASIDSTTHRAPQSSAAPTILATAPAPKAASPVQTPHVDTGLSATGASAPTIASPPASVASLPRASGRRQPPAVPPAQVPQPVGTIKVTRPDLVTAPSAPAGVPVLDSTGSLFGLADSVSTAAVPQIQTPQPSQPASIIVMFSPDQAPAPSVGAPAVSAPPLKRPPGFSNASPSPAASTAALSRPSAPMTSVVRSLAQLADDIVGVGNCAHILSGWSACRCPADLSEQCRLPRHVALPMSGFRLHIWHFSSDVHRTEASKGGAIFPPLQVKLDQALVPQIPMLYHA